MDKPTLTIFANFRINNEERYQRMKDSFMSFKDINAEKWVINVRGSYKLKTLFFLRENLGKKLYPHLLESGKGWFHDTREMLSQIDTDFVFFWIEDHINLVDVNTYDSILQEMEKSSCESLLYSFLHQDVLNRFTVLCPIYESKFIKVYNWDIDNVKTVEKKVGLFYIVSAVSIFKKEFFKKLIKSNHPFLKRWPKETPFDFEKKSTDKIFLPITYGIPKYELFAPIDDDVGNENYSLISRGLYPNRMDREVIRSIEFEKKNIFFKKFMPTIFFGQIRCIYRLVKRIQYSLK